MLTITPRQLSAFEAIMHEQAFQRFAGWYAAHAPLLPPADGDALRTLWRRAHDAAAEVEAEGEDRIRMLAAALALLPDATTAQWLLALDLVFARGPKRQRLEALAALRTMPE